MDRITHHELPESFHGAAGAFEEKEKELCEMGVRVGDRSLDLTMQKSLGALLQLMRGSEAEGDIGKTLMEVGMKIAGLTLSTTEILISSGIIRGGEATGKKREMGPKELAGFLAGFARGITHRGKCRLGGYTVLGAVDTEAKKAQGAYTGDTDMGAMLQGMAEGARGGVRAIGDMLPRYGKTVMFSTKAKSVLDQGTMVGQYLLEGLDRYFLGNLR